MSPNALSNLCSEHCFEPCAAPSMQPSSNLCLTWPAPSHGLAIQRWLPRFIRLTILKMESYRKAGSSFPQDSRNLEDGSSTTHSTKLLPGFQGGKPGCFALTTAHSDQCILEYFTFLNIWARATVYKVSEFFRWQKAQHPTPAIAEPQAPHWYLPAQRPWHLYPLHQSQRRLFPSGPTTPASSNTCSSSQPGEEILASFPSPPYHTLATDFSSTGHRQERTEAMLSPAQCFPYLPNLQCKPGPKS